MKKIKLLVYRIDDELEGAKDYAESYLDYKASNNMTMANKYKEMAGQELQHAFTIHEEANDIINRYKSVSTPPQDMVDKWDREHKKYIEKSNWIKLMLNG